MYLLADKGDTLGLILADSVIGVCVGGVAVRVDGGRDVLDTCAGGGGRDDRRPRDCTVRRDRTTGLSGAGRSRPHLDAAPGIYLAVAAIVALLAIRSWPESAFETLV